MLSVCGIVGFLVLLILDKPWEGFQLWRFENGKATYPGTSLSLSCRSPSPTRSDINTRLRALDEQHAVLGPCLVQAEGFQLLFF